MAGQSETGAEPPQERPFQFGMKVLFVLPIGIAVFSAVATSFGMPIALLCSLILSLVGLWFRATRQAAACALVILLPVMLLLPAYSGAGPWARESQCTNNIKLIALALHNYHDQYGCLPPAYIADKKGRPMHSWRVLILPYLEQQPLYDQYDFDEPWDGPNNSRLGNQLEKHYWWGGQCPEETRQRTPWTSYVAVTGPGTLWPGSEPATLEDCSDGLSNTILVVEVANSGIRWMEPRDLDVSQLPLRVNPQQGLGISSRHRVSRFPRRPGCAYAAFADGTVGFLPDALSAEELRAMLTIDRGEEVHVP